MGVEGVLRRMRGMGGVVGEELEGSRTLMAAEAGTAVFDTG